MQISDYGSSLRSTTATAYRATARYLSLWQSEKKKFPTFSSFFADWELSDHTKQKHLRQAKTLYKRCGLDWNIGTLSGKITKADPPKFSDSDFQTLYESFSDCQYPKFIISGERYRYWQCLIHFAAVTALRREAILRLKFSDIDLAEFFVTVPSAIDKKNKTRCKPITQELAIQLVELRQFFDTSVL